MKLRKTRLGRAHTRVSYASSNATAAGRRCRPRSVGTHYLDDLRPFNAEVSSKCGMFREDRSWRGTVVHSRARSLSHRFPRGQGKLCLTREATVQDLTTGSLTGHLLRTTSYMLVSMIFQTLYVL